MTIIYRKILITIFATAIALLCWAVDLSAQEEKDDKKLEITGYFGTGGQGSEGGTLFEFAGESVLSYGLGLEYLLTPRISIEGEFNYLPNIACAPPPHGWSPWGESLVTFIGEDEKYRFLCDINLLFYFDLSESQKPTFIRLFLTVGTGYQYDRMEYHVVSLKTLEQSKYGYGKWFFQLINFGAGFKVRIKGNWSLRLLARVHGFPGEDGRTDRLALGISYQF